MSIFKKTGFFLCFMVSVFLGGCIGRGGSGSPTVPIAPTVPTNSANSPAIKSSIARWISQNYHSLDSRRQSIRAKTLSNVLAAIVEDLGVGTIRITYGPADSITILGTNVTYTGGYQILETKDIFGNLTNDDNEINTLVITNYSVAYTLYDEWDLISAVSTGKLTFSGILSDTSFSVSAENFHITETINNSDTFSLTMNGSVAVDVTTFPYPKNGQSESGTMVFNGSRYDYRITYNGTNIATCSISGAENFTFRINLSTGSVI